MKIKKAMSFFIIMCVGFALVHCANQNKKSLSRIHFDYDQSQIRSDMISVMDGNVSYIKGRDRHFSTKSHTSGAGGAVTIEGHCDNRGTNEYNYALGHRRAESAKSYLVSHGVSASGIKTASFGEDRPLCDKNNESCWYMNRRDEFKLR